MKENLDLNIAEELVKYVNAELLKGKSIATVEKENSLGKDTLRKRLNRNNYYFNKKQKAFVHDEERAKNKNNITHNNTSVINRTKTVYNPNKQKDLGGAEQMENIKLDEFKALSTKEKIERINQLTQGVRTLTQIQEELGFTNVGNYISKSEAYWDGKEKIYKLINKSDNNIFSADEVMILKEIISNYEKQKNIKTESFEGEVTTRSFRSYKAVMDDFAEFCSKNNLSQKDAIATALTNFMKNI